LLLEVVNKTLHIKSVNTSIVNQTAGSLTQFVAPSKRNVSFETIIKETKRQVARRLALQK
jgi:hypothetical protein